MKNYFKLAFVYVILVSYSTTIFSKETPSPTPDANTTAYVTDFVLPQGLTCSDPIMIYCNRPYDYDLL